jgi:hypothetical protein
MLSGAQRSRSISIDKLTFNASNEAVEMLRLRSAPLSMTDGRTNHYTAMFIVSTKPAVVLPDTVAISMPAVSSLNTLSDLL